MYVLQWMGGTAHSFIIFLTLIIFQMTIIMIWSDVLLPTIKWIKISLKYHRFTLVWNSWKVLNVIFTIYLIYCSVLCPGSLQIFFFIGILFLLCWFFYVKYKQTMKSGLFFFKVLLLNPILIARYFKKHRSKKKQHDKYTANNFLWQVCEGLNMSFCSS